MPATMFDLTDAEQWAKDMGKFVPKGKVLKPVTYFEPNLEKFL